MTSPPGAPRVTPLPEVERLEKPKKRKKPRKQTLLAQADALCGRIVRARGRCEECGSVTELQWAHGFSRSYRKVRHDLRNGFCLCRRCHMRFTHNPLAWDDWLRDHWGPALYNDMRVMALSGPRANLAETVASLKVIAATLDAESPGAARTAPGVPSNLTERR